MYSSSEMLGRQLNRQKCKPPQNSPQTRTFLRLNAESWNSQ